MLAKYALDLPLENRKLIALSAQHFDFGTSSRLSLDATYSLLYATLDTLSSDQPLFVLFHDPRADLRALHTLGFEHEFFSKSVATTVASNAGVPREGLLVCDTQTLYSAWAGVPYQTKLSTCCDALQVSSVASLVINRSGYQQSCSTSTGPYQAPSQRWERRAVHASSVRADDGPEHPSANAAHSFGAGGID
jgi:hypothetical protein